MDIITSYSFIIVALGTFFLATSAGLIGCINVYKGQSLIGDAIGHSTLPGVILAFMISLERNPLILMIGAFFMGIIAFIAIQFIKTYSRLSLDAILAIVLSTCFGLGLVLKTYIQGNKAYSSASQSGLSHYIFGQAAFISRVDVYVIFGASLLALAALFIFYKEIKVYLFDSNYAKTIGLSEFALNSIILFSTILLISTGIRVVGVILIASMLVIPAIIGMQWSQRFFIVLSIAGASAGLCAVVGTYLSTVYDGLSTGPTIIVLMSLLAAISLAFGPRGLVAKMKKREVHL